MSETNSSIELFGNGASDNNNSSSDSPKETSHTGKRQKRYEDELRGEFRNTRSFTLLMGRLKVGRKLKLIS